jgi:hypothetical protein
MLPLLASFLVLCLPCPPGDAAVFCCANLSAYYVSPTGSDSNPGTLASPFLTLEKAQTAMRAGSQKKTYLRAGTYTRTAQLALTSADNGETWATYSGDAADGAKLVVGGSGNFNLFEINGASQISNITISNLTMDGGTGGGFQAALRVDSATDHLIVTNNVFQNFPTVNVGAFYVYNSDYVFFQGNTVTNVYQPISMHLTDHILHGHWFITDNTLGMPQRMGMEMQDNNTPTVGVFDVHVDRNDITTWNHGPAFSNNIGLSFVPFGPGGACNTIYGNTFHGTSGVGGWAIELVASNTYVSNNTMTNVDYGFFFAQDSGSLVELNTMTGSPLNPFNKDGGWDNTQWVGTNTLNGVSTDGWSGQPNSGSKPTTCSPSPAFP